MLIKREKRCQAAASFTGQGRGNLCGRPPRRGRRTAALQVPYVSVTTVSLHGDANGCCEITWEGAFFLVLFHIDKEFETVSYRRKEMSPISNIALRPFWRPSCRPALRGANVSRRHLFSRSRPLYGTPFLRSEVEHSRGSRRILG